MTRTVSLSSAIAHRLGMALLIASLIVAGWAVINTSSGPTTSAIAYGARSVQASGVDAAAPTEAAGSPVDLAGPALVPAQDDGDDSDEENTEDEEPADEEESEDEEVTVKVKYVGAESDFELEVITGLPLEKGDDVGNGDQVLEVSTRPIFVFEGASPAIRSLEIGTVGIDVLQIERALSSLGYNVGKIDPSFDAATAAAVAAFYEAQGYELPAPSKGDLKDLADAQDKLAEAHIDRERLIVELSDENRPDLVSANEDLVDLQKAEADLKQVEIKLNELREKQAKIAILNARFNALVGSISAGLATGDIDPEDTESVSDQIAIELDALIGDDPDDFDTFEELFVAVAEEQAKVIEDLDDASADITLEEVERDVAAAEIDLAWDKVLEVPSTAKVDDIRLQLQAIDIKIAALDTELATLGSETSARLSIDEFVFAPNLPGEIDDVEVDVLDEADGTLLKIVTG